MDRGLVICAGLGFATLCMPAYTQVLQKSVGSPFSMFAAQDFSAWKQYGNANWQYVNQQAFMTQGNGWLVSKLPLKNIVVDLQYWVDKNAHASLFVRCTDTNFISQETAYQINLSSKAIDGYGAGALVGTTQVSPQKVSGQWNALKVSINDSYLNVWLNEHKVIDNLFDTRFSSGPLAIHAAGGEFRVQTFNVTIPGRW